MSILTVIKDCLHALTALAVRARNAITQTLSSTSQQTETTMTDPQTTDAATDTQTDATTQTANADATTDATSTDAQDATQEPRDLDVVFSDYEAALLDFNSKVEQANAAKATALSAAQRVADLKKELDSLEGDVEKSFAPVEAFLACA